jgi:hypothetical protein
MENSIHHNIRRRLETTKSKIIFPPDLKGLGTDKAINMSLSRLTKQGKLKRLAHGIYLVPKKDRLVGVKYPSLEEIAQAIARRDRARIRPAGAYALHKLGLSTQVPMKLVYLTDGTPRKIRIGKGSIKFKASAPKKLSLKGKISSLVVMALEELGAKNITGDILEKIKPLLRQEDPALLKNDLSMSTATVRKILEGLINQQPANDGTPHPY